MAFALAVAVVGVVGAVMAALTGAGIGSTLIPLFSLHVDFKLAVAAAAVPHLVGSAMRVVELRAQVDRALLLRFGVLCAVASFAGALAQKAVTSPVIAYAFGGLLVLAGLLGLLGASEKVRLPHGAAWVAGAVSGLLGGLAGEQGGLRAVALMGFDLRKEAFVATSTAVAVIVDVVRAPVYLVTQWSALRPVLWLVGVAVAGVVVGTLLGRLPRQRLPERTFRRVVAGIVVVIGVLLLLRGR
jgi:uncharacterized membrane protein YfcA